MTALCGGGPSQIKPTGIAAQQVLSPDALADLIGGGGFTWFVTAVYAAGYLTFDLTDICATDPPALPNVDAGRLAGYFNPLNPQGAAQLREDATTIATYVLWYLYCQCADVATPPQGPALPAPTGVSIDAPLPTSNTGPQCGSGNYVFSGRQFDANGNITWDQRIPETVPPGIQWFNLPWNGGETDGASTAYPVTHTFTQLDSNSVVLSKTVWTQTAQVNAASPVMQTAIAAPGAHTYTMTSHTDTGKNLGFTFTVYFMDQCTAPPPNALAACCPPDPLLVTLINTVLQLENQILSLLPAGKLPYIDSTIHPNLSGNGTIIFSPTAKAIRCDITTRPTPWPSGETDPHYLFSIGFLTPFAVGTPLRGSRIVYDHQIFEWPTYTDQIGYALPVGVTIQLVELVTS